jgi:acyl carrier protein
MKEDENLRKTIFKLLKNIAPETDPQQLKPEDNIRQTLSIDSFDYLQFIIGLDEALGIQTPEEDYGQIESLKSLLDYLGKKQISSSG